MKCIKIGLRHGKPKERIKKNEMECNGIVGMYKVGIYEVGMYKVGMYKVGMYEVGMYKVGMYKVGMYEVGMYNLLGKTEVWNPLQVLQVFLQISGVVPLLQNRLRFPQCLRAKVLVTNCIVYIVTLLQYNIHCIVYSV